MPKLLIQILHLICRHALELIEQRINTEQQIAIPQLKKENKQEKRTLTQNQ